MDRKRLVRRSAAALALALLLTGTACGGGGGEAKQKKDDRDQQRTDDDKKGAPGQDGDTSDQTTSTTADGDGTGRTSSTTSPTATTDGSATNGLDGNRLGSGSAEAARKAYAAYQAMFERLVVTPDPDDHAISRLTSGRERSHVVDTLNGLASRGQAVEFGNHQQHNIYDAIVHRDGTVTVLDCMVSDERVVDTRTRVAVSRDPEGGAANVITAVLSRTEGQWKVAAVSARPVGANQTCGPQGIVSHSGT